MGFSYFTRRYCRNHCYFLFLRLVICLNSAGSLACQRSCNDIVIVPTLATLKVKRLEHKLDENKIELEDAFVMQ